MYSPSLYKFDASLHFHIFTHTHTPIHIKSVIYIYILTKLLASKHSEFPLQLILVSTYSAKTITDVCIANLQGHPHSFLIFRYTADMTSQYHSFSKCSPLHSNRSARLHKSSSLDVTGCTLFGTVSTTS